MQNAKALFLGVFFLLALALGPVSRGQQTTPTGIPPFSSIQNGVVDVVNLSNLNIHITIPVLHKTGRGVGLNYDLTSDNSVWEIVNTDNGNAWGPIYTAGGWNSLFFGPVMGLLYATVPGPMSCGGSNEVTTYENWFYMDRSGTAHPFIGSTTEVTGSCSGYSTTSLTATAADGSGYTLKATGGSGTITGPDGTIINPPAPFTHNGQIKSTGTLTDSNGNEISVNSSGVVTDTLGQTALTIGGSTGTPLTYTPPSGPNVSYTVTYTGVTLQTNFGCSGIHEFSNSASSALTEIELPDGTSYKFTYEPTPGNSNAITGRIASITLPTGGTISYAYTGSNNGIECSDGSAAGLNRTTPDGEWKYVRAGTAPAMTTTITDPKENKTVVNFQGGAETERQVNTGSSTLLKTIFTCYNGNVTTSTCNSTTITPPITEQSVFTQWPGTSGLECQTNSFFDSYGLLTETDAYAYGSGTVGALVSKTIVLYANMNNGIVNKPTDIRVENGSNLVEAEYTYLYDQGAVTGTSGTPQHVAVSGNRGNFTTYSVLTGGEYVNSLSKTFTYFDTGNVSTATDVNGAKTTYTYGDCGNSFPTSISEPLNLSRSAVWDCIGAVETSVTDENGQKVSSTYNDPYFWRANALTDQELNETNVTYTGQTSSEAALIFHNNTSASDILGTSDGLGRINVSQVREAPGSNTYDSVESDYDSLGRPSKTSLPYSATTIGQTNSSAPGTTTAYDALSRRSQITDSGGRLVTFTYSQNDTYRTLGPAPTSENRKRNQFEYDALGRMTSVCEITAASGNGTCGQTSTVTGYWTKYTYDLLNDLVAVTQNAQSTGSQQMRTYVYDDSRRITSETNPESGTTSYTYDYDATCGTSHGDLVKKIDAVGNTTCYAYDALHRNTSVTYSGPYSANTPNKYFIYDAATVNGVAMTNVKTRMAEAYTATSSTGTKITDIGLSYTVRGEISDVYESTPNSGSYYHTGATYWANGALDVLTALYNTASITGLPTFTYGPDGEGRLSTVSANSGANPVSSTTYNVASLPTLIRFGSSDSDSFAFDSNTNRMTQYEFTVNGQNVIGKLTWNSIGTLETLAITDPFYAAGNQTCSYKHDDMTRLASANCGSPWSQTFTYDAFGNINKTGTVSFQPTYSYLTNHMTQVGSSTPTYDANGNATNDTAHTYTWDANGKPVAVDGVNLTYDALGRMVEQNRSGVYNQIVYAPTGGKFAIMNGATLLKAFVPLTGGSQAVYNASGLAYYRHSDWIGSSRFASTPARAMYYDGAYAPFGEAYAQTGTTDLSFTGMNQDTVANLYDFPGRELNNIHGRWPSPDPAGISVVHVKDPQTWNRYAYVRNSPLHLVDPLGLVCVDLSGNETDDDIDGCAANGGTWVNCDSSCAGLGKPPDTGCLPGDFSCDPFSNDSCLNPYSGGCASGSTAFQSILAGNGADSDNDPCVYLNSSGAGFDDEPGPSGNVNPIDKNSSKGECSQTGGQWVPTGYNPTGVNQDGNVTYTPSLGLLVARNAVIGGLATGLVACAAGSVPGGVVGGALFGAPGGTAGGVGGCVSAGLPAAVGGAILGALGTLAYAAIFGNE